MTDTPEGFKPDADTLTMVLAMGALAMAVAHVLTPEQQTGMAQALAAIAKKAEKDGDTALETFLIGMHRAIS